MLHRFWPNIFSIWYCINTIKYRIVSILYRPSLMSIYLWSYWLLIYFVAGSDFTDDTIDLMMFFSGSAYSGFGDDANVINIMLTLINFLHEWWMLHDNRVFMVYMAICLLELLKKKQCLSKILQWKTMGFLLLVCLTSVHVMVCTCSLASQTQSPVLVFGRQGSLGQCCHSFVLHTCFETSFYILTNVMYMYIIWPDIKHENMALSLYSLTISKWSLR